MERTLNGCSTNSLYCFNTLPLYKPNIKKSSNYFLHMLLLKTVWYVTEILFN